MTILPVLELDPTDLLNAGARARRAGELMETIAAAVAELRDLVADPELRVERVLEAVHPPRDDDDAPPAPADPPVEASQTSAPAPAAPHGFATGGHVPPLEAVGSRSPAAVAQRQANGRGVHDEHVERVRAALRRLPHDWHGAGQVAGEAGSGHGTVVRILRELRDAGELEHNGKGGAWSKYRTVTPPPSDSTDPTPLPAAAGPGAAAPSPAHTPSAPAAAPQSSAPNVTAISPRVRRELDREEKERQEAKAAAADAALGTRDGNGTLAGKITEALMSRPCGPVELGKRLDVDVEELIPIITRLVATGELIRHPNPDRSIGAERVRLEVAP